MDAAWRIGSEEMQYEICPAQKLAADGRVSGVGLGSCKKALTEVSQLRWVASLCDIVVCYCSNHALMVEDGPKGMGLADEQIVAVESQSMETLLVSSRVE